MVGRAGGGQRRGTPVDYLVVGLGNPGRAYAGTRHNVGADAVALLAERCGERLRPSREHALVARARLGGRQVVLAFPTTYMNDSGRAVGALYRTSDLEGPGSLIVVHDELDLEPGRVKLKAGGGLAGHNGLRSIVAHLHTPDFLRVRIGIGKPPGGREGGVRHVLAKVGREDGELLGGAVIRAADAVEAVVAEGLDAAMRTFNSG